MTHGMTGDGDYDRHSDYQMHGGMSHADLVRTAAAAIELADRQAVIVDYGCAQGRVSNPLIAKAIDTMREAREDLHVFVCHNDIPDNDWDGLARNLRSDDSYLRTTAGPTTPIVSATSFYSPVMPARTVDLGLSFAALQWLSAPGPAGTGSALYFDQLDGRHRSTMAARAAADWKNFIALRSRELAAGGRLVLDMMGIDSSGLAAGHDAWERVRSIVEQLVDESEIEADRLDSYVFPVYERSLEEVRAPFDEGGADLRLDHVERTAVPNPIADAYAKDGDAARFARDTVGFIRAFAEPSLRSALELTGSGVDELFGRLTTAVERDVDTFAFDVHAVSLVLSKP